MKCPICGADKPDGAGFCESCYMGFGDETVASLARKKEQINGVLADQGNWWRDHRRKRRAQALAAFGFAAAALALILIMMPFCNREERPETLARYPSERTGLSFSYPESWEKEELGDIADMVEGIEGIPNLGNEIVLMKRGAVLFKHLFIVTSEPWDYDNIDWSEYESSMKLGIADSSDGQRLSVSFFNPMMPAETGARGFGCQYTMEPPGALPCFQVDAYVNKGDTLYSFKLMTPLKGGGSDELEARERFNEIIQTMQISE